MMAVEHFQPTAEVLVVGNPIVGQVLALLLGNAHLSVRYESELSLDEPSGLLDGIRLVLIAPGTAAELREGVLKLIREEPLGERMSVLELTANYRGTQEEEEEEGHCLQPWPCAIKDLKRRIQDILFAGEPGSQDLGMPQR